MPPSELPWLWIPVTLWAAFAQTLRNAAQRHLVTELGTLGATLVRFLYGLPFASLWLGLVLSLSGAPLPSPEGGFILWVLLGATAQIAATALLLLVMAERNFALGVAYSKTELVQVALFGLVFLADPLLPAAALAIGLAMAGLVLLSPTEPQRPFAGLLAGWTTRPALLGVGSGAGFALAAVGYRGGALALGSAPFVVAAAYTLLWAQTLQTALLGAWLLLRDASVLLRTARAWRASLFAGFMGAAASAGWFTAMAIEPVAHVRTLGVVELLFSYVISLRLFRERLRRAEVAGMALLALGLVTITLAR
ncbi:MAG: EamA/RhaT family transporter [Chloroflexi bacterium]|nr:EamA/RhaT family transporter [Chloroflexota bacterium]